MQSDQATIKKRPVGPTRKKLFMTKTTKKTQKNKEEPAPVVADAPKKKTHAEQLDEDRKEWTKKATDISSNIDDLLTHDNAAQLFHDPDILKDKLSISEE